MAGFRWAWDRRLSVVRFGNTIVYAERIVKNIQLGRKRWQSPLQHLEAAHDGGHFQDIQLLFQQHALPPGIVEAVAGLDALGDELHPPVDGHRQAVPLKQAADDDAGKGVPGAGIKGGDVPASHLPEGVAGRS